MQITHIGEDYGTIEIGNKEYEVSRGLAKAIKGRMKEIKGTIDCLCGLAEEHCPKCPADERNYSTE